jgi:hypothetical protein
VGRRRSGVKGYFATRKRIARGGGVSEFGGGEGLIVREDWRYVYRDGGVARY